MIAGAIIVALLLSGLYQVPIPTLSGLLAFTVFYLVYLFWVFKEWNTHFSGHRTTRRDKNSPSNRKMPPIKTLEENKKLILNNSKHHEQFDTCELLNDVKTMEVTRKENHIIRERAKRSMSLSVKVKGRVGEMMTGALLGSLNHVEVADELDMDHVYVSFFDFLWAFTFIGPFSYLLWKHGTIVLRIRQFLWKRGLIKPEECDYEAMCATLLLEQTQAIHYYARTDEGSELGNIAGFFFANFPWVDNQCNYQVADLFAVDIDLDTKRFVKAKLDDINLNAKETVILLWFNTIAAQHVKLHAMANWGVNVDESLANVNPFFRQSSVVTIMYNYFGYTSFNGFLKTWAKEGLVSPGRLKANKPLVQAFNHGIKNNVWQHAQIVDLVKYSDFVNFVVQVRSIFFAEFEKHKKLFPGTDGEAMFVGTILHSLDHCLMDWNVKDPLWLDVDDPRFGKMAEVGRIVKVGFVSDVPGLYFHKRFKGSGHPFYDAVYRKAAKVNKKLADNMDTCIIK
mmetsp:Transcript_22443/g.35218  ORF Transcript_22443/g.35218 Transcript_22443/m.35218 type:complete len:509 (+) Transcript_22443:65-1591(+)